MGGVYTFSRPINIPLLLQMHIADAFQNRLLGYKYNLTAVLCIIPSLLLLSSPVSLEGFLHDHFVFLTGAYRILNGQIPHVDFISPLGGLSFLLISLSYTLLGAYSYAIPLTLLLIFFVVIVCGSILVGDKMGRKYYSLLLFYVTLVCTSPFVVTIGLSRTSYAMWYNRFGWSIFVLISVYFLCTKNSDKVLPREVFGLVFMTSILAYIKPTFVVAIIPIAAVGLFFDNKKGICYYAFFSLLVAGIVEGVFPGFSLGYVWDLLAASEHSGFFYGSADQVLMYLVENLVWILCFVASVLVKHTYGELDRKAAWQVAFIFLGTWWLTNQAALGIPLGLAAVPIWAGSTFDAASNGRNRSGRWEPAPLSGSGVLFGLALLITVPTMGERLWTLGDYVKEGYTEAGDPSLPVPFEGFEGVLVSEGKFGADLRRVGRSGLTMSASLCTYADASQQGSDVSLEADGFDYVQSLQAAVNLTEQHVPPEASVLTFDFVNPINLLTDRPPTSGKQLWYHKDRTFSSEHLGPPEQWLRGVRYILVPRVPVNASSRNELLRNAGCFLENKFEEVERTALWILLKRPESPSASDHQ